jgi:hypothetical protein
VRASFTWSLIRQMLPEFGGERELALRLGLSRRPELRYSRRQIRFATAMLVHELYNQVMPIDLDQRERLR